MPMLRGYMLPIAVVQSAATASPATVWAMRNTSARRLVYLRQAVVNVMFTGTAAATMSQYQFVRFRTATPTGGSALTVFESNATDPSASTVTDARFVDTGLTVAGMTFDAPLAYAGAPRQLGASAQYVFDWEPAIASEPSPVVLAPGEGLCIQLGVAAVIGDSIMGYVEWNEMGTLGAT